MAYKKVWMHSHCGGEVDVKKKQCRKCKKKWSWWAFLMDPTGLRLISIPIVDKTPKQESRTDYAKWADKIPYVGDVAARLPKWPRWARIATTVLLFGAVTFAIALIWWRPWERG